MRFDGKTQALAALLAIGIAIGCGVLAGLFGTGHFDGRYAVPVQGDAPHVVTPSPVAAARPAPPPKTVPPPPVVAAAPLPPDRTGETDEDEDGDRIADAIGRATQKALDRGEPVRWHKAGRSGFVVVSEAQYYPGRSCRSVSATIVDDEGGQTRSAPHLWCQSDEDEDGDWQAVR